LSREAAKPEEVFAHLIEEEPSEARSWRYAGHTSSVIVLRTLTAPPSRRSGSFKKVLPARSRRYKLTFHSPDWP
jgi:hypothetical protein